MPRDYYEALFYDDLAYDEPPKRRHISKYVEPAGRHRARGRRTHANRVIAAINRQHDEHVDQAVQQLAREVAKQHRQ